MNEVDIADLTPAERRSLRLPGGKSQSKYGNRRVFVEGRWFASGAEARYYQQLLLRQAAGELSGLRCQVHFQLAGQNGETVGEYVADFTFMQAGKLHILDVKGGEATKTQVYKLKRRLMACQGYEIEEVPA